MPESKDVVDGALRGRIGWPRPSWGVAASSERAPAPGVRLVVTVGEAVRIDRAWAYSGLVSRGYVETAHIGDRRRRVGSDVSGRRMTSPVANVSCQRPPDSARHCGQYRDPPDSGPRKASANNGCGAVVRRAVWSKCARVIAWTVATGIPVATLIEGGLPPGPARSTGMCRIVPAKADRRQDVGPRDITTMGERLQPRIERLTVDRGEPDRERPDSCHSLSTGVASEEFVRVDVRTACCLSRRRPTGAGLSGFLWTIPPATSTRRRGDHVIGLSRGCPRGRGGVDGLDVSYFVALFRRRAAVSCRSLLGGDIDRGLFKISSVMASAPVTMARTAARLISVIKDPM